MITKSHTGNFPISFAFQGGCHVSIRPYEMVWNPWPWAWQEPYSAVLWEVTVFSQAGLLHPLLLAIPVPGGALSCTLNLLLAGPASKWHASLQLRNKFWSWTLAFHACRFCNVPPCISLCPLFFVYLVPDLPVSPRVAANVFCTAPPEVESFPFHSSQPDTSCDPLRRSQVSHDAVSDLPLLRPIIW